MSITSSQRAPHSSGSKSAAPKPPVYEYDASRGRFAYAFSDLQAAFRQPGLIRTLVVTEFLDKYRSSLLGGFWITLTTAATVTGLALLYSRIFGVSLEEYFPHVAVGLIVWATITGLVNEGAAIFIEGSSIFNQAPLPKSLFAFKAVGRAILNFAFRVIVLIVMILAVGLRPSLIDVLLSICGFLIILWIGFWSALGLGTLAARFRDVSQLAATMMTMLFFLTPVFWQPERLGDLEVLVYYNPFYHLLHIVRAPLVGEAGITFSFTVSIVIALVATTGGAVIFGYFARRLSYWC